MQQRAALRTKGCLKVKYGMIKNIGRNCTERNTISDLRNYKPGPQKLGFFHLLKLKTNNMKLITIALIVSAVLVLLQSKLNNRTNNY
jgi:hypothetical protein